AAGRTGATESQSPAANAAPRGAAPLPLLPENWPAIIDAMGLSGITRQLAANCALAERQGAQVRLLQDPRSTAIRTPANEARLAEALARYVGEKVRLVIEQAAAAPVTPARALQRQDDERLAQARAALESDPNIQAMQRQLGATIFPESVRPN